MLHKFCVSLKDLRLRFILYVVFFKVKTFDVHDLRSCIILILFIFLMPSLGYILESGNSASQISKEGRLGGIVTPC